MGRRRGECERAGRREGERLVDAEALPLDEDDRDFDDMDPDLDRYLPLLLLPLRLLLRPLLLVALDEDERRCERGLLLR